MADVRSAVSALEEKRSSLEQRVAELQSRISDEEAERKRIMQALDTLENEQQGILQQSANTRSAFNEAVQREREASADISALQQSLETARREYAACMSSAKMLSDFKLSFEGYGESVKSLMLAARSHTDIGERIKGSVADVMHVPAQYETAVEACLGGALQNIIVEDEYDAKHIIAHLRKNNMGRVTFLPVKSLKTRHISIEEQAALSEAGVLGVASELVACDEGVRPAINFLLARTVIVDNSDTAIRVMRRCAQSLRVVTVAGDVFNPGGSITGGSIKRERSGLVSRDRREEEMRSRAVQFSDEAAALESALQEKMKAREALTYRIESLRGALQDCEVQAAAAREKREGLSASETETAARADAITNELATMQEKLTRTEQEIDGFAALQSDIRQTSQTRNEDYKRLEEEYSQRNARIDELKTKIHDAEVRIAGLFRENAAMISDNMRLGLEKTELERLNATRAKTLELLSESAGNFQTFKKELEQTYASRAEVLESHKKQQSEMSAGRVAMLDTLTAMETEIDQARRDVSELSEKSLRTMFNIEKAQTDIEAAQNRLWDSYQLTYANALTEREDIDMTGAQAAAEEIRVRLRDLGSVNPSAIDDYTALKERMAALSEQKEDLINAEEDLRKLITSLLGEMKRTFRQSFEQINKHFETTFKELFDGGRAELILEEGDIMECGIEIVAEPPGKKLQKISLLSGGEKALTAISLLFALLKINPSPVCILDEIDAALDDANVQKFSEYLEKYARNVQFIVITHRKPTMAVCDSLFGFAMEEKGVSKLLSVRLDREGA
jgi:chromosome segregation protein